MIAVDTSALMAIAFNEADAERCMTAIEASSTLLISAGTVAESLIVAGCRNVGLEVASLKDRLCFQNIRAPLADLQTFRLGGRA